MSAMFSTKESRRTRAHVWLRAHVTLPEGAGIGVLMLLRSLPMVFIRGCKADMKLPFATLGKAEKEHWITRANGEYVITDEGRDVLQRAEAMMPEIERVNHWINTGEGEVPSV